MFDSVCAWVSAMCSCHACMCACACLCACVCACLCACLSGDFLPRVAQTLACFSVCMCMFVYSCVLCCAVLEDPLREFRIPYVFLSLISSSFCDWFLLVVHTQVSYV